MIDLSRDGKKFLGRVSSKEFGQLWGRIQQLETNPYPNDYSHVRGYARYYRIDVGEFRVIYRVGREPGQRSTQAKMGRRNSRAAPGYLIDVVVVDRRNDNAAYKRLKRVVRGA